MAAEYSPTVVEYLGKLLTLKEKKRERYNLEKKIEAAVSAHRTIESLLKEWPEIKSEIPAGLLAPPETAPKTALSVVAGLNVALGLPKSEPDEASAPAPVKRRKASTVKKAA